jgi:hypothetical protein
MDNTQVLASKDGIMYEQVRLLFYDEHNDIFVCMRADGLVICYNYIKDL